MWKNSPRILPWRLQAKSRDSQAPNPKRPVPDSSPAAQWWRFAQAAQRLQMKNETDGNWWHPRTFLKTKKWRSQVRQWRTKANAAMAPEADLHAAWWRDLNSICQCPAAVWGPGQLKLQPVSWNLILIKSPYFSLENSWNLPKPYISLYMYIFRYIITCVYIYLSLSLYKNIDVSLCFMVICTLLFLASQLAEKHLSHLSVPAPFGNSSGPLWCKTWVSSIILDG